MAGPQILGLNRNPDWRFHLIYGSILIPILWADIVGRYCGQILWADIVGRYFSPFLSISLLFSPFLSFSLHFQPIPTHFQPIPTHFQQNVVGG